MPYKDREKRNEWYRHKKRQQRLDPLYRQQERLRARQRRGLIQEAQICEICGYSQVTDVHHEKNTAHVLCPNCHALITRGMKTMDELKGMTKANVQPFEPVVQPVTKCSLPNCIICHPEKYQLWFKKTFGRYDTYQGKLV